MAEAAVGLGNTVAAVPASGFFVDQKRGEVNELKTVRCIFVFFPAETDLIYLFL